MGVCSTLTNTWEHDTAYTYDSMSRLATLASLGKSATYTRINSSNRLSNVALNNSVNAPNVAYMYDAQLRLTAKSSEARVFNAKDEVVNKVTYNDPKTWYYDYDAQGQLQRSRYAVAEVISPEDEIANFSYDQIGNVLSGSLTYNNVNQPSNLVYDADGNMTKNGSTLYTYDAENRLKTMGTSGNYKEFFYDYAGRCFKRQTVRKTTTTSVTVNEYLIYDKTKIIAVLNGSASAITEKYTWQPPTSGDADVLLWDATSVYASDCNKNIVKRYYYVPDYDTCTVDTYSYTPFGTLRSGSATPCRFGFSSEESYNGLYLYLYRAYSPSLKRWLTRDPIEENGGVNLYGFVGNTPISRWDELGARITGDPTMSQIPYDDDCGGCPDKLSLVYETDYTISDEERENTLPRNTVMVKEPAEILADIEKYFQTNSYHEKCHCIQNLTINGHGSEGVITLGPDEEVPKYQILGIYYPSITAPDYKIMDDGMRELDDLFKRINKYMCGDLSFVKFVTCYSGAGTNGERLHDLLKYYFPKSRIQLYDKQVRWAYGLFVW